MITFQKILFYIITFFIGALFLFGAYAKIIGLQNFEWTLAETNIMSFGMANVFSRILIIAEALMGFFFLFNINFNQQLYKWAAILLAIFNIYLLWVMHNYGFSGNCGCFGDTVQMTPIQASIKNIFLLMAIYYLSCFKYKWVHWNKFLIITTVVGGILYYIPPDFIYIQDKDVELHEPINLDEMYGANANSKPPIDFKKGKHILCVMSTTCHHCKSAARKVEIIHKRNPNIPFYILFAGDSVSLNTFYEESRAQNIPHQLNKNYPFITNLIGLHTLQSGFPKILWIEDGYLVRISNNYFSLNQSAIEQWLQKK